VGSARRGTGTHLEHALDVLRLVLSVDPLNDEVLCKIMGIRNCCTRRAREGKGRTKPALLRASEKDLLLARALDDELEDAHLHERGELGSVREG